MILVLVMRRQLRSLISAVIPRMGDLTKVTGPMGLSAEWAGEAQALEEQVEAREEAQVASSHGGSEPGEGSPGIDGAIEHVSPEPVQPVALDPDLMEIVVRADPRSAVIEAWAYVEHAMRVHLRRIPNRSVGFVVDRFVRSPSTPPWLGEAVETLGALRNRLVHGVGVEIDEESARSYVNSAIKIIDEIDLLTTRLPGDPSSRDHT